MKEMFEKYCKYIKNPNGYGKDPMVKIIKCPIDKNECISLKLRVSAYNGFTDESTEIPEYEIDRALAHIDKYGDLDTYEY
ncbi:MAG: hypothetical protein LBH05_00820 [Deferribacteraceae bacterium]|nr:hypothetical protein [Deferribacteraceae bacterium]